MHGIYGCLRQLLVAEARVELVRSHPAGVFARLGLARVLDDLNRRDLHE